MARITVEDCLKRVSNRFLLVNMAAKRVRQLREGSEYLVSSPKNEDIVVALREIAAGMVTLSDETVKQIEDTEDTTEADAVEAAVGVEPAEADPAAEEPEKAEEVENG